MVLHKTALKLLLLIFVRKTFLTFGKSLILSYNYSINTISNKCIEKCLQAVSRIAIQVSIEAMHL